MTKITLLERLKEFSEIHTGDLLLPVQPQEEDVEPPADRPATVYTPCLPELRSYARKAPFTTHEIVTSKDVAVQRPGGGKFMQSTAVVRTCFCVYHKNEQEGKLALLTLMERTRIALLEEVVIGGQFKLDAGVPRKPESNRSFTILPWGDDHHLDSPHHRKEGTPWKKSTRLPGRRIPRSPRWRDPPLTAFTATSAPASRA